MQVFTALLCVALVAVASGSPAINSWLSVVNDVASQNINKATNIASEKGKEGLAKVQELLAELQKQAAKCQAEIQAAVSQAEKTGKEYVLKGLQAQIEKLKQVEEKLSGWMG